MTPDERWAAIGILQDAYPEFRDFYWDCSTELLGFEPSEVQMDIADYLQYGPPNAMIQAQRGEAKTTITGCYDVWCLIHDPSLVTLILSAGGKMAKQISTWCIQIINGMDILECLRVDKSYPGARSSVEAYDVHYVLKGADKSPSIACLGITSNNQGYRAHLLIADDIESKKNSYTENMRETLLDISREFSSFVQEGRIVYLGTPQSVDSIYNSLFSRGYDIRIWPGRVPTEQEMSNYETNGVSHLAPIVQAMIDNGCKRTGFGMDGTRGPAVDPVMMNEEKLIFKEVDKGAADFDLQYMLNTCLSDEERFPLKIANLMFYGLSPEKVPGTFLWAKNPDRRHPVPNGTYVKDTMYMPLQLSEEYFEYTGKFISIDPSGGGANGDETGYAVLYTCNGYIFVMEVGGFPGGFEEQELLKITEVIKRWGVGTAIIEKNYGNGALGSALQSIFIRDGIQCSITDVWSSGQKEQRIIDNLTPIMGVHKLVINSSCLEEDVTTTRRYPAELRASYSWLFQMSRLTRDKGSLKHDDRLEAIAQGCGYLATKIKVDAAKEEAAKIQQQHMQFIQDPMGIFRKANIRRYNSDGQPIARSTPNGMGSVMDRFKRR